MKKAPTRLIPTALRKNGKIVVDKMAEKELELKKTNNQKKYIKLIS